MLHGYEGGALTETRRVVREGKNAGKSNATSAHEQAIKEATARHTKQIDKGYRRNKDDVDQLPIRPMLAQSLDENEKKLSYPCITQPKLNGVRCIAYMVGSELVLLSRGGKKFEALAKHKSLVEELRDILSRGKDLILDGELYIHGEALQDISGSVRAFGPLTRKLQYWVYDCISGEPQYDRLVRVRSHISAELRFVKSCPMDFVKNYDALVAMQKRYIEAGYEGLMARNYSAAYKQGTRSYNLLKYKNFLEREFKIVGAQCSNDREVIWICRFNGEAFDVVPRGSSAQRKEQWIYAERYFGKPLTVRYSDVSKRGVPQGNPVGVCIRDYE